MKIRCIFLLCLLLRLATGQAAAQQTPATPAGYLPETVQQAGLQLYFQYEAALDAAEKARKPLMLYFADTRNVNCQSMEKRVWTDPDVLKMLKEDFIVAVLHCNLKDTLPLEAQYRSRVIKKQVLTNGDRNLDIEATYFDADTQPFYIFIDSKNRKLAPQGFGYNADPQPFLLYLQMVKNQFKKTRP
jgi:thiol:disulfide interchange protein DsbD